MSGDTRAARWARTLAKLRRWAVVLREHGFEVTEPANADTPPHKRVAPPPSAPV